VLEDPAGGAVTDGKVDPACYWLRDSAGFCLLENRCWSGKRCPKTQREADQAREQLVDYYATLRDRRQ
jgi:hypothetical protein